MSRRLKAPFPWFGGKSSVAHLVWERFGDVPNYVEPFFGSGAVMLARPHPPRIETVNDLDCYIANFWRAVTDAPGQVARYADWPVNEADLHARHKWLVNREKFRERMKREPGYYNAKIAGWWVWGISCWIGSGWCSKPEWAGRISGCRAERGVHQRTQAGSQRSDRPPTSDLRPPISIRNHGNDPETNRRRPHISHDQGVHSAGFEKTRPNLQPQGVHSTTRQKRPNLHHDGGVHTLQKRPRISGYSGSGVHKKVPNIGDRGGRGVANIALAGTPEERNPRNAGLQVWEKRPALHRSARGVSRQLPDPGGDSGAAGRGVHGSGRRIALTEWMQALADRLRCVRVCCGDWKRVLGRSPTECIGTTAIFLDPPYSAERDSGIYSSDSMEVAHEVRAWAIAHGNNPKLRIALCGYAGEHEMPADWTCLAWKANGGHGNAAQGRGRANAARERIWFSPHCLSPCAPELF